MGQVLIRNLDDEVITAYREAAERNARSLEAELREVLRRCRPHTASQTADLQAQFSAIRAMTPDVPQTPSEILVREDRDGFRQV